MVENNSFGPFTPHQHYYQRQYKIIQIGNEILCFVYTLE